MASSKKFHLHPLTSIFLYLDNSDLDAPVRGRYSPGGSLGPSGPSAGSLQHLQVRHTVRNIYVVSARHVLKDLRSCSVFVQKLFHGRLLC
jgi:hypothetical protein